MNPWTKFVQNISAKLAFFPPSPTYEVQEHNDGTGQLYIQPKYSELPRVLNCTVKKLKTKKRKGGGGGDEIVAAFIPYVPRNGTKRVDITILYSHGNAVDLGQLMPFYKDLSRALRANIMAYDYTGYGGSTGQATVQNTLADVEAVFTCLQHDFGVQPASIIAYGQSVGSGPTAWLAATHKGLAGVVMHTPLLSGIRVLNPGLKWWPAWADVYPNHLLVSKIDCPLLVLHGTEDEVIHFSHGKRMHELARNKVEPLWAVGYNHQNLELCPQYLPRLRRFIADLFPYAAPPASSSAAAAAAANAAAASAAAAAAAAGLTASPPPQNVALQDPAPPQRPATASGNIRATWSVPVTAPERRDGESSAARRPAAPLKPLLPRGSPGRASPAATHPVDDEHTDPRQAAPGSRPTHAGAAGGGTPPVQSQESAPTSTLGGSGPPAVAPPAAALQPRLNFFSIAPLPAASRAPSKPPHSGLMSVPWPSSTTASPSAATPLPPVPIPTTSPAAAASRKLPAQEPHEPLSTPSPRVTADILPCASPPSSTSGAADAAAPATPTTASPPSIPSAPPTSAAPTAIPAKASSGAADASALQSSPATAATADPTPSPTPSDPTPGPSKADTATIADVAAAATIAPPLAPPSLAATPEKAFLGPGSAITADTPPRPLTAG